MTKPYRKRAQNSGQAGKGRKTQSDREERQHAKREVRQAVAEMDPGYLERHHKGARTAFAGSSRP